MNIVEQTLIIAARRIGSSILGPNPHVFTSKARERIFWACQNFLEAYAPEYANVREHKRRVAHAVFRKLEYSLTQADVEQIARDIDSAKRRSSR